MSPNKKLRIVTWNCCKGSFTKKDTVFEKYNPDIAIIQEIKRPKKENDEHCIWVPNRLTKELGVCVISLDDLTLQHCEGYPDLPEVFIPVNISGKVTFNLLAVWTQKTGNYIESFKHVLEDYQKFLQSAPSVIAGDFNSNPRWDREYKKFNHSMLIEKLDKEFNLVSAYHKKNNTVQPGHEKEIESTFFMYGHQDKPFHIDYCFVPKSWTVECAKIGLYDNWCNKEKTGKEKKSDHCPLIVDLLIDDASPKTGTEIRRSRDDRFCAEIETLGIAPVPESAKQRLEKFEKMHTASKEG